VTELLEDALRKIASLPKEEQDAIAAQIIETLQDETAWKEKLARTPEKLVRLAQEARAEHERGETRALDELLRIMEPEKFQRLITRYEEK